MSDTGWFVLNTVTSQLQSANGKTIRDLLCVCVKIKLDPECVKVFYQKETVIFEEMALRTWLDIRVSSFP